MGETGKHAEIESTDAQSQLWNQLFCFINSMSLSCAVELGIAEIITSHGSAPVTLPQLAASIPVPPNKTHHLRRIMRLLVHSGVFAAHKFENGDEGFLLTPMSRLLVNGEDGNNLSPFTRLILDSTSVSPWHFLGQWLKAKDGPAATPYGMCHGAEFWDFANRSPQINSLFNQGMACDSSYLMSAVLDKCTAAFNGLSSLVDVAGGTGSTAQCIAEAFPHMTVSVLDQPHVVAGLQDSKVKFVEGDMFHSIPPADAVFLKWVLHGWNDEDCVKILKKCKEAIPNKRGKVMIVDIVVNFNKDNQIITKNQFSFDLFMMVVGTGMERNEEEWKHLFDAAGYTSYKIIPLLGGRSFIELYP